MTTDSRRPLASRDTRLAQTIAGRLATMSVTPNMISQASMAMAALAGTCFWLAGDSEPLVKGMLLVAAAVFCQLRLLCNLFDGMVAVEGGKAAADGPFWNEFPDRIADMLIFVGIGYAVASPGLGWAAAAMAVMTAYVRELGRANGAGSDFSGPMAKQHRMAVVTLAALVSVLEFLWDGDNEILRFALWVVAVGAAFTALRRGLAQIRRLNGSS
ncbi:CDP-alcohol phosphatidyltransferase family protein [Mesorhizobium sp. BE184]|uniref:CDP-alcohol phosphatidyltransferase family protein n=1 Tax=Mesorhizobium sp. BE184 TaxID=2817714 RepID=UPI002859E4A5|nr:CDP-alcohol phosphatidyltransferase family protein [Mesorhizobium sp. BE184]MDR7031898.1 phosphatidylglycerophosphate synthase [Mesorhizobium sp. BE184]